MAEDVKRHESSGDPKIDLDLPPFEAAIVRVLGRLKEGAAVDIARLMFPDFKGDNTEFRARVSQISVSLKRLEKKGVTAKLSKIGRKAIYRLASGGKEEFGFLDRFKSAKEYEKEYEREYERRLEELQRGHALPGLEGKIRELERRRQAWLERQRRHWRRAPPHTAWAILIAVVFVALLAIFGAAMTGFVVGQPQSLSQPVALAASQNSTHSIILQNLTTTPSFYLASIKINGTIMGGTARIYALSSEGRFLVFDTSVLNLTNGSAAFNDACANTCGLARVSNFTNANLSLQIDVDLGAVVTMEGLSYALVNTTVVAPKAQPQIDANITLTAAVRDPNGTIIRTNLAVLKIGTNEVQQNLTGDNLTINLQPGKYNLKIRPLGHKIREMLFNHVNVRTGDGALELKIDHPAETPSAIYSQLRDKQIADVYAIDPTALNFTDATITIVARGDALYKCAAWDFERRNCTDGNWTKIRNLVRGQEYQLSLTAADPGFIETIQPSQQDSHIVEDFANRNFGGSATLEVRSRSPNRDRRALVQFDLTSIPLGVRIDSAVLMLNIVATPGTSRTYNAHRITSSWTEGTGIGGGADTSDVTWNSRTTGVAWTTPGGDFIATPSASNVTGTVPDVWVHWNITSDVRGWYNGSFPNFGTLIKDNVEEGANIFTRFTSKEDADTTIRPKLVVNYTDITPPQWSQLTQNNSEPTQTQAVLLSAFWNDNVNLSAGILETNETGVFQNKSGFYGSPLMITGTSNYTNFTWLNSSVPQGISVGWRIYVNDTSGNLNRTDTMVFKIKDTTAPTPVFVAPTPANNSLLVITSVTFNITATDNIGLDSCRFEIDSKNTTVVQIGGISANCTVTNASMTQGNHTFRVWVDDTTNNFNVTESRTITVDTIGPSIGWMAQTPANNSVSTAVVNFNATVSDSVTAISFCFLQIDNTNFTATVVSTGPTTANCTYVNASMTAGGHTFRMWANDSVGNLNSSETRTIAIDLQPPSVVLVSPTPTNNSVVGPGVVFNASAIDSLMVGGCLLELDGINSSMTSIGSGAAVTCSSTNSSMTQGSHTFRIWANDSAGNFNSSENRTITVFIAPPAPTGAAPVPALPIVSGPLPPPPAPPMVPLEKALTVTPTLPAAIDAAAPTTELRLRIDNSLDSTQENLSIEVITPATWAAALARSTLKIDVGALAPKTGKEFTIELESRLCSEAATKEFIQAALSPAEIEIRLLKAGALVSSQKVTISPQPRDFILAVDTTDLRAPAANGLRDVTFCLIVDNRRAADKFKLDMELGVYDSRFVPAVLDLLSTPQIAAGDIFVAQRTYRIAMPPGNYLAAAGLYTGGWFFFPGYVVAQAQLPIAAR